MAITDPSFDSGLTQQSVPAPAPAPAYRWLTTAAAIEPMDNHQQRWLVTSRDQQHPLGEVWLDQHALLHCQLDATAQIRRDVAMCIQQCLRKHVAVRFAKDDDALLDLIAECDHAAFRVEQYDLAIANCCDELGISANYGDLHRLSLMHEPDELISIGNDVFQRPQYLSRSAATQWRIMVSAAAEDDVVLQPVSAFRDYRYQATLLRDKLARDQSIDQILCVNAAPGFSEHHTAGQSTLLRRTANRWKKNSKPLRHSPGSPTAPVSSASPCPTSATTSTAWPMNRGIGARRRDDSRQRRKQLTREKNHGVKRTSEDDCVLRYGGHHADSVAIAAAGQDGQIIS